LKSTKDQAKHYQKESEKAPYYRNEKPEDAMNDRPPSTRGEIAIVCLTAFIFITYLTSNYFLWKQSNISKQGADAATSAAQIAQNTFMAGQKSAGDILVEMQNQSSAMQSAAKAANAQTDISRHSLDATITASRLDQRAWIGVLDPMPGDFSEATGFPVTVVFFNSGRTPASNVQSAAGFKISPSAISGPSPEDINQLTFRPGQSIAPQGRFSEALRVILPSGDISTPGERKGLQDVISRFQLIKAKKVVLYIYGILKYDDAFGKHRTTNFCIFMADPDTKRFGFCDNFNDLN
jgi:hypothetical protein